jgi:hypothetical protein
MHERKLMLQQCNTGELSHDVLLTLGAECLYMAYCSMRDSML